MNAEMINLLNERNSLTNRIAELAEIVTACNGLENNRVIADINRRLGRYTNRLAEVEAVIAAYEAEHGAVEVVDA